MNTALLSMGTPEARLTVGIEGSFGVLQYPVLVLSTVRPAYDPQRNDGQSPWLPEDLLGRGFRPVRNPDIEDIVLKAQLADGSIHCRVSSDGFVSLLIYNNLVWSRQVDPEDPETALWIKAARTKEMTIVINNRRGHRAEEWRPEVMAKVPTIWFS